MLTLGLQDDIAGRAATRCGPVFALPVAAKKNQRLRAQTI